MKRLLPFRIIDEQDVINMFALGSAYVNSNVTGVGYGDDGVLVTVENGNLNADMPSYATDSYLGKTDFPFVGRNQYPSNPLTVRPTSSGERPLGITLNETAQYDENGEKLLYYPQKAEEMQVVLPGQSTRIATRGVFHVSSQFWEGPIAVGTGLRVDDFTSGKTTGCAPTDSTSIARVLATGARTSGLTTDKFAGDTAIIKLEL